MSSRCYLFILLSQIGVLLANVSEFGFIDTTRNQAFQCDNLNQPYTFCPQNVYTFTCAVDGNLLSWTILDNGTPIPGSSVDFSALDDTDIPTEVGNFTFTLIDKTNGLISVVNFTTQNSIVIEGDGLRCSDGVVVEICEFIIDGTSNCSNVESELVNDTVRFSWDNYCAASYSVEVTENGQEMSMVNETQYVYQLINDVRIEALINPTNLFGQPGEQCSRTITIAEGRISTIIEVTTIDIFIPSTVIVPMPVTTTFTVTTSTNAPLFVGLFSASAVLNIIIVIILVAVIIMAVIIVRIKVRKAVASSQSHKDKVPISASATSSL